MVSGPPLSVHSIIQTMVEEGAILLYDHHIERQVLPFTIEDTIMRMDE